MGCLYLCPAMADTLVGANGLALKGEIVSMANGELTFKTQVGTHNLPMSEVKSFTIEREASASPVPSATPTMSKAEDQQILSRLDSLATSLANLERQILKMQTAQEFQSRQIDQRTLDLAPERSLKVKNTHVNTKSSGTAVTGQIVNDSSLPISNVQAEVVLYGRTGRLRMNGGKMTQVVSVSPSILLPGQTGSFVAQFESGLIISNYDVFPHAASSGGFNSELQTQPNATQF